MTAVSALGAIAMLTALAFAATTAERYAARGRLHELAWTQSMVMFAIASGAYWSAGAVGWNSFNFRVFYLFGAILNVPYLAIGTVALLGGVDLGRRVHRALNLVAVFCAGVLLVTPMRGAVPRVGLPEGKELFDVGPRIMAAVGSGVAATVLIVGALWSAWALVRHRRRPAQGAAPAIAPARLAVTNVLIAVGSIVLSLGGSFFTGADREVGFGIFLVAGIVILFGGFLVSSPGRPVRRVPEPPAQLDAFYRELWDLTVASQTSTSEAPV